MGQFIGIAGLAVTVFFVVAGLYQNFGRRMAMVPDDEPSGTPILVTFAVASLILAGLAVWHYWHDLVASADRVFVHAGLILAMVAGCFVRVMTENKEQGRLLFAVKRDQLIYPLLFSPIIFYTIWSTVQGVSTATTGPVAVAVHITYFHFYCAFVNGYFWQSIVAAVKPNS